MPARGWSEGKSAGVTFTSSAPSVSYTHLVSEPCSAVDIVHTLSNLFGLEYDSRLLSGRDVLDQDYDPADATVSYTHLVPVTVKMRRGWDKGSINAVELSKMLEQAGIADDTVICLAADHYPYRLSETDTDYYNCLLYTSCPGEGSGEGCPTGRGGGQGQPRTRDGENAPGLG